MNIQAVSSSPISPAADAAVRAAAPPSEAVDARPRVRPAREAVPPPGLVGSNTIVEFTRHEGTGAEVVKFVDKRTGELIDQTPAQQVLDAVTNLMQVVQ